MTLKTAITVELADEQARALAHFSRRKIWADVRQFAASNEETYLIRDAFDVLHYALTDASFSAE